MGAQLLPALTLLGQAYWLTGDEALRAGIRRRDRPTGSIVNPWGHGVNWACAMDRAAERPDLGLYFVEQPRDGRPVVQSRCLRSSTCTANTSPPTSKKATGQRQSLFVRRRGLVFLGCFFDRTPKGRAWRSLGRAIVLDEMLLQVAEDGVDFEASTAYRRLVLEPCS